MDFTIVALYRISCFPPQITALLNAASFFDERNAFQRTWRRFQKFDRVYKSAIK